MRGTLDADTRAFAERLIAAMRANPDRDMQWAAREWQRVIDWDDRQAAPPSLATLKAQIARDIAENTVTQGTEIDVTSYALGRVDGLQWVLRLLGE